MFEKSNWQEVKRKRQEIMEISNPAPLVAMSASSKFTRTPHAPIWAND
jgi:hypothetical protein